MVLVILAGVLQVREWRDLSGRVTSGGLTKGRAVRRYIIRALAPSLLLAASFLGAVGLDEWFGVSLVGESMARAVWPLTILLLSLAGLGSLGFAVTCSRLRTPSAARGRRAEYKQAN
jgi:hypothetical protein